MKGDTGPPGIHGMDGRDGHLVSAILHNYIILIMI